ncbi:methionine aminotransferase [Sediminibacterium sp. TEGAF015]|uniref:methionine aminotransferase n=1 Tax=Sediminibacterium sp. TEGAF015 TaxID=575378 RepID=UPI0022057649|nr:methionine aminotransferase [Sediminibacterium sp. TEGAF015]BDQ12625.1 aminotransferase [Sediminibacterium sp. TEGAF015]
MSVAIQSKLPQVGTTIFTVMSQLANEAGAVNLGQGFPDFPMSVELTSLVSKAMQDGFNQYTHMNGYPPLVKALAAKANKLYNASIDPAASITITPGGTYAIYTALTTVLQPGDEVIVFEPAYDCYIPTIELNKAIAVPIQLQYPNYGIPWEEVKSKITSRTRMIMINSPHNPTGAVLSAEDMQILSGIVEGTNIIILSDEVYEHLIFDGIEHQSILKYPHLFERSFVCFSFGKTYHCTGWKLGYCMAPEQLMKEFRKVHQFNCFTCPTPPQVALATYIENEEAYLSLGAAMQTKRDYFRVLMRDTPFTCIPSQGSYFECYSYASFSQLSDKELAIKLTKEFGVATIPVSAFYQNGQDNKVLRFCFAKSEATLEKAVQGLRRL